MTETTTENKTVEWVLRLALFATFIGHGILAIMMKAKFVSMFTGMAKLVGWAVAEPTAQQWIFWVGIIDVLVAFAILYKPIRGLLLWAFIWAFLTAIARPLAAHGWAGLLSFGDPNVDNMYDFIERAANYGIPLALLYLRGLPKTAKEWFE
jgi:hypothetical protein